MSPEMLLSLASAICCLPFGVEHKKTTTTTAHKELERRDANSIDWHQATRREVAPIWAAIVAMVVAAAVGGANLKQRHKIN